MSNITWSNPYSGGLWSDGANWSDSVPPGPGDTATIEVAYTVTLDTDATLDSLTLGFAGASPGPTVLDVTGSLAASTLTLNGATLHLPNATIFDGGAIDLAAVIGGGPYINYVPSSSVITTDTSLTLGASEILTVSGNSTLIDGAGALSNLGTIAIAPSPASYGGVAYSPTGGLNGLAIATAAFSNAGIVTIGNNSLAIGRSTAFSNTGTISLEAGGRLTVWLDSDLAGLAAAEAGIVNTGGTLYVGLTGSIDNTGSVFDFAAVNAAGVTGFGGVLTGGTIEQNGGALYIANGTLDGVTLTGSLATSAGSTIDILHGLTVTAPGATIDTTGTVAAGPIGGSGASTLHFLNDATLDNVTLLAGLIRTEGTLTLGAGATLDNASSYLGITTDGGGALVNQGVIRIDDISPPYGELEGITLDHVANSGSILIGANNTFILGTGSFANTGLVQIASGATLHFTGAVTDAGTLSFAGAGGVLQLDHPSGFTATLDNFQIGDTITLAAGSGYALGFASGTLDLFQNGTLEAGFNVGNTYDLTSFTLDQSAAAPVIALASAPGAATGPTGQYFLATDTSSSLSSASHGDTYSGPVGGLAGQFVHVTPDNLNIATATPNVFIRTGSGNDAVQVTSGDNVIDASSGSNFLVGGTGNDTFFLDTRDGQTLWDTITNFHAGDAVTIWGFTAGTSVSSWADGLGAPGYTGLTLQIAPTGGDILAKATFAGLSSADLPHLAVQTGSVGGNDYLSVIYM